MADGQVFIIDQWWIFQLLHWIVFFKVLTPPNDPPLSAQMGHSGAVGMIKMLVIPFWYVYTHTYTLCTYTDIHYIHIICIRYTHKMHAFTHMLCRYNTWWYYMIWHEIVWHYVIFTGLIIWTYYVLLFSNSILYFYIRYFVAVYIIHCIVSC
jgi:hypothetical protein